MYYSAGYYLLIPKHEKGTVNGHTFIDRTWSVSTYISHVYPGDWGFSWSYSKRQLPKNFSPTSQELEALHTWIEKEFTQGNYLWPGFFLNQEKAIEFKNLFLASLPQIKLVGIFLHETHCFAAIARIQPATNDTWPTLATILKQQIPEPNSGHELGFDLLGLLEFGGYEPFSYHVLEKEYHDTFGVALNEYGLFTSETDCQQVATYTDTVADEPAVWFPFKTKLFGSNI